MLTGEKTALGHAGSAEQLRARIADLEASVLTLENRLSDYNRVFFQNPVPSLVYDASTLQILEANDGALQLYGYDRAQICALNIVSLFRAETLHGVEDLRTELGRQMNAMGPFAHVGAGGRELSVGMVVFALDVHGADARIAMLQDETARRIAEEALRASEERYRDLFENANDVIFLHDLKGKVVAVNRAAEYLTGYSRAEIMGADFSILLAPEARDAMQDSIRAHLGGSPTQHYELPIVSKFGTQRFLEVSTRIIYRRGQPVAVQGIGRDVTERKHSQQRLVESARELQLKNDELSTALQLAREATQLKEQFLANTSHELRTPMNGIMGMTNLLKDTPLSCDQREYVEAVSQCADDLLTIINDLLDVSQIGAGRFSLTEEPFDVQDSIQAVVKMLRLKANSKGLALTYELDPSLPPRIFGDSVRFRQVLINLIANAIKFTTAGSVHVRVVSCGDAPYLICQVVDSGIGVEESVRERIFEAFFQADGTLRRRFGGTGLGLTISKQLVEIMGGRIGMNNNDPGPGSTFWFELPLRISEMTEEDRISVRAC
ncbi:MAG: PAS domain S-box protein [Acidobacteriota bacterium]|nr:PAS domain S-box protein [Acidobacteriota bacterium]